MYFSASKLAYNLTRGLVGEKEYGCRWRYWDSDTDKWPLVISSAPKLPRHLEKSETADREIRKKSVLPRSQMPNCRLSGAQIMLYRSCSSAGSSSLCAATLRAAQRAEQWDSRQDFCQLFVWCHHHLCVTCAHCYTVGRSHKLCHNLSLQRKKVGQTLFCSYPTLPNWLRALMDYLRLTRGVSCDESVQRYVGPQ